MKMKPSPYTKSPRNQTSRRSFMRFNNDVRIDEIYYEGEDGYWVSVAPGWTGDRYGAHDIHENTVQEVLDKIAQIVVCDCDDCKAFHVEEVTR